MRLAPLHINRHVHKCAGLTLIDLLVVLILLVVLGGMLLPRGGSPRPAKVAKAKVEVRNLAVAIQAYYTTYLKFPVSDEVRSSVTCGCS